MSNNPAFKSIKNIVSDIYSKTTSDNFSQETLDEYRGSVSETVSRLSDLQGEFVDKGDNMGAYLCELKSLGLSSSVDLIASTSKVSTGQINIDQQASLFMNNIQNGLSKLTLISKMDTPEDVERKQFMADAQSFYDQKTPEHLDSINNQIDSVVKSVMSGDKVYSVTEDLMSCVDKYGKEFCDAVYTPRQREALVEYSEPKQDKGLVKGFGLDGYSQDDIARIEREFQNHAKQKNWGKLEW